MSIHLRPTAVTEHAANPYTLRQLNKQGDILSETQVVASSYSSAVRKLKDAVDGAERIDAYNHKGEKVGEVNVDYWRLKRGRL